jgi:hypothetical protein
MSIQIASLPFKKLPRKRKRSCRLFRERTVMPSRAFSHRLACSAGRAPGERLISRRAKFYSPALFDCLVHLICAHEHDYFARYDATLVRDY